MEQQKLEREYGPEVVVAGMVAHKDIATGLLIHDREAFETWMNGDGK